MRDVQIVSRDQWEVSGYAASGVCPFASEAFDAIGAPTAVWDMAVGSVLSHLSLGWHIGRFDVALRLSFFLPMLLGIVMHMGAA